MGGLAATLWLGNSDVADLAPIRFTPVREVVSEGSVEWVTDKIGPCVEALPQIFWSSGEPWHEANHWALTRVRRTRGGHIRTVTRLMSHLVAYASWLEAKHLAWRHFPMRKEHRAVVQYRAALISRRDDGEIAPSTATAAMRAVIQYYRHCQSHGLIDSESALWKDSQVLVRYFDATGFQRTVTRISSELSIPNAPRHGTRLEDGLTPLRSQDATRLLEFAKEQSLPELHLMLSIGVLTGARLGTITTLGVKNLEMAYPDPQAPDIYRLAVGPGTGVRTKFGVNGEILVPKFLIDELKQYAYSVHRLRRQNLAAEKSRGCLFLSRRGNPYGPNSINPLMSGLRKRAASAGLRFMERFKFHQTRATFGTSLMQTALTVTNAKAAVAILKAAMLHKDERTTLLYVRFLEEEPVKAEVSNQFTTLFSGVVKRDWSQFHA
jgi:integrase